MNVQSDPLLNNNQEYKMKKTIVLTILLIIFGMFFCCGVTITILSISNLKEQKNSNKIPDIDVKNKLGNILINKDKTENNIDDQEKDEKETNNEQINDEQIINGLSISLNSLEILGETIQTYYDTNVTANGKYVKLVLNVENTTDKDVEIGDVYLIDSKGNKYIDSWDKYSVLGDEASFFMQSYKPNENGKYTTLFDINKDSENIIIVIKSSDFSSDDEIRIEVE